MTQVLLVGNPNTGKTTLFNALTGDNQRVGNWPGVTVEKKTGNLALPKGAITLTDLPGLYSLSNAEAASQDEAIAVQALLADESDYIVNVVDACHLERHLYLTSQLLELRKPLIVVLTMMDLAKLRGIVIDTAALEGRLGCTVVAVAAHKKAGMEPLLQALAQPTKASHPLPLAFSPATLSAITSLEEPYRNSPLAYYYALRAAESNAVIIVDGESLDIIQAQVRYSAIHDIVLACQTKASDASDYVTAQLDKVILHRLWGLPLFFGLMYLMFWVAMNLGGALQDFFDVGSHRVFVQGTAWLLSQFQAPALLTACLAYGLGRGLNTLITFIPVVAAMYFFLSLLESSGYMARAAFVMDKAMRLLGLPGKSFVPMLIGFGCNVPAIMATRTLASRRDRLLTVMMSPFMSCSARLTIYAVFVAAFFPKGGQNIVFSLYIIGIIMAVLTGFILKKTHLQGETAPMIIELPAYHKPSLRRLLTETGRRLQVFLIRAGKLIIPLCVALGALNAISFDGGAMQVGEASAHTLLSLIGQAITPLLSPMGIQADNWPASVGLLTGVLAKEVVVGTLNTLYAQTAHLQPGLAATLSHDVYGEMARRFDGPIGAYAYLLFILLYIPCVSTMAAIRQEAGRFLMNLSIVWSLLLAYTMAVGFYQIATFAQHPTQSVLWVSSLLGLVCILITFLARESKQGGLHAATNS